MIRAGLAVVAVLMVSGCGGGADTSAFVKQCKQGGDDEKTCSCVAEQLQKNLSPEAFKSVMLDAAGKSEEANKIRSSMPMDKQMAAMTSAVQAAATCAGKAH